MTPLELTSKSAFLNILIKNVMFVFIDETFDDVHFYIQFDVCLCFIKALTKIYTRRGPLSF